MNSVLPPQVVRDFVDVLRFLDAAPPDTSPEDMPQDIAAKYKKWKGELFRSGLAEPDTQLTVAKLLPQGRIFLLDHSGDWIGDVEIPPLERRSGEWTDARSVAEEERLGLDSLRTMRNDKKAGAQKDALGNFGIDKAGRIWRKESERKIWYYRPSLKNAKVSGDN